MTAEVNGQIGTGLTFQAETAAGNATYSGAVDIVGCTPPAPKADSIDVTTMGSPSNFREFIPGLINGGSVSLEVLYNPASATDLFFRNWQKARERRSAIITFGNTHTITSSVFVTDVTPAQVTPDGLMKQSFTLQTSGPDTIA